MSHPLTNFPGVPMTRATVSQPPRSVRSRWFHVRAAEAVPVLMFAGFAALAVMGAPLAQEHSNPWLLSWIPSMCCVTNDCCWEITERELRPMPDDYWQVVVTGQVRPRTDWSPDGRFYRCACDYDKDSGKWIRHDSANTRCLFVPMRSASRGNSEVQMKH